MTLKKGFTLIELLVSTSIFALIGVAIYSAFANGITVWKIANIDKREEKIIRLTLEKMAQEIRNVFAYDFTDKITFLGEEHYISFPSIVNTQRSGTPQFEVGRIVYFFDEINDAFYRQQKTYPEVFPEVEGLGEPDLFNKEFSKKLVSGIKEIDFTYFCKDLTDKYDWQHSWGTKDAVGEESIPKAVKIELTYEDDTGDELKFSKTIFIPIGTGELRIGSP